MKHIPSMSTVGTQTTRRTMVLSPDGRLALVILVLAIAIGLSIVLWNGHSANRLSTSAKHASSGVSLYKKGDFKGAVPELRKATELNPANANAQRSLGQAYEATGKLDDAAKAYRASLAAKHNQPEVLYNLAIIHKSQGKSKEAISELESAVKLNKQFVAARLILGDLYAAQGQKAKAKRQYRAVIDMEPFGVNLEAIKASRGESE